MHTLAQQSFIGPILDEMFKENPGKVSSVFTFVCVCMSICLRVCVCTLATEHIFWHRNLMFGLSDP